jgi:hypothetical protein
MDKYKSRGSELKKNTNANRYPTAYLISFFLPSVAVGRSLRTIMIVAMLATPWTKTRIAKKKE